MTLRCTGARLFSDAPRTPAPSTPLQSRFLTCLITPRQGIAFDGALAVCWRRSAPQCAAGRTCFRMIERAQEMRAARGAARPKQRDHAAIRRAYFAAAANVDSTIRRFGVTIERVVEHAQCARGATDGDWRLGMVRIDDLALAVACVEDRPGAWAMLAERHEHALVIAAETAVGSEHGALTARCLLRDARRDSTGARSSTPVPARRSFVQTSGPVDLRRYSGMRSLRSWLLKRLAERIEAESRPPMRRSEGKDGPSARLRLAMRLLERNRRWAAASISGEQDSDTGVLYVHGSGARAAGVERRQGA